MRNLLNNKDLNEFANLLLDNGFKVMIHKPESTWIHYEKDGKIAYVQIDRWKTSFSSVHKGDREIGSAFRVSDNVDLTVENAEEALNIPRWALNRYRHKKIKTYSSLEEYKNKDNILEYTIIE